MRSKLLMEMIDISFNTSQNKSNFKINKNIIKYLICYIPKYKAFNILNDRIN